MSGLYPAHCTVVIAVGCRGCRAVKQQPPSAGRAGERCRQQVSGRWMPSATHGLRRRIFACQLQHEQACRNVVRAAPALTVSDPDDALQTETSKDPCTLRWVAGRRS